MELLFDKKKHIIADLAAAGFIQDQCTIGDLLVWIKDNLLKEKPSMFMQGDTVRPGILVLINDADWELEDGLKYKVKNGDNILFISTLHGG